MLSNMPKFFKAQLQSFVIRPKAEISANQSLGAVLLHVQQAEFSTTINSCIFTLNEKKGVHKSW